MCLIISPLTKQTNTAEFCNGICESYSVLQKHIMLIGYIREAVFSVVLHIFGCLKFYRTLIKNNPVLILVESENFLTEKKYGF